MQSYKRSPFRKGGGEEKRSKRRISDNVKAGAVRWWFAGMCYFFIGFGTQAGAFADPLDLIFFLGTGLGLVTVFLYNPVVYRMFDIVRKGTITNRSYFNRTGWQNAGLNLAEIFKNLFVVFLVYMTYQTLNLVMEQALALPEGTVTLPGEPFGFATIYIIYYYLLAGLLDTVGEAAKKSEGR